jgi:two-component system, LytTR family, response regulator
VIRALIVDDEPLARETLRILLQRDPEIAIAGECSGVDAVAMIEETRPDLLFLDVQMPEVGGFDVLESVGADAVPVIVFVTAYDRYALRAFDVHALDYLLKPFDDRRFDETLRRAKEHLRARGVDQRLVALLEERTAPYVRRFVVRLRDKVIFVNADDVDWIEAADDYVQLHAGGKTHLLRERIAELEQRLDPEQFIRVHRSAIVNLERVRELHPLFRGDSILVLSDGSRVRLARARREQFEAALTRSPLRTRNSPQSR